MYAAAAARADGLLLLCGGRDVNNSPLVRLFADEEVVIWAAFARLAELRLMHYVP